MQAETSSSVRIARDELPVAAIKPYFKLRLGGSRSVVTGKFLKDTPTKFKRPDPPLAPTRSRDTHSIVSSRSTDSSASQEKVRIMGRGGAGARRRNYSHVKPVSSFEMRPLRAPEAMTEDDPVLRNVGRGGLGSRPHPIRGKANAAADSPSHKRKNAKKMQLMSSSVSLDRELRPQSSASQLSTISTIHFAGESGQPPPDFFKVTKKKSKQNSVLDNTDEELTTFTPHPSPHDTTTPSAAPWDDTPTTSRLNLASSSSSSSLRAKARRRERGFSMLFSLFQHDATTRNNRAAAPSSVAVPSQITLTSIATDPSSFFHGSESPPSTPPRTLETDSTTGSSCSTRLGSSLSSYPREPSLASSSCNKDATDDDDGQDVEFYEPPSPLLPDHGHDSPPSPPPPPPPRKDFAPCSSSEPIMMYSVLECGMHLSASEAEALGTPPCSPLFMQEHNNNNNNTPFVPIRIHKREAERTMSKGRMEEAESWTGEWNVAMGDVIRALRELR